MKFQPQEIYHIYNRGNKHQTIFYNRENYLYFLQKVNTYIIPRCSVLAWCLMPTHFHFLIHTDETSCAAIERAIIPTQHLTEGVRLLLSSYTKGINKQKGETGNLFQQKTKAKCISEGTEDYGLLAFYYIHQNPLKAGLVNKIEDYEFSSFPDYINVRKGQICDKWLAYNLLDLNDATLYHEAYHMISEDIKLKIM